MTCLSILRDSCLDDDNINQAIDIYWYVYLNFHADTDCVIMLDDWTISEPFFSDLHSNQNVLATYDGTYINVVT